MSLSLVRYCNLCKEDEQEFENSVALSCILCELFATSEVAANKAELDEAFKNIHLLRGNMRIGLHALKNLYLNILNWTRKDAKTFEGHMFKYYYMPAFTEPFQKMLIESKDKEDFLRRWYVIIYILNIIKIAFKKIKNMF